jgi:hypothetical protein
MDKTRLIKIIVPVLVVAAVGLIGIKLLAPSHAATAVLPFQEGTFINDYNGGPLDVSRIPAYEAWLGHPIQIAEGSGNLQSYSGTTALDDEHEFDSPWVTDAATKAGKRLAVGFQFMTYRNGHSDGETYGMMAKGSNTLPSGYTVDQRYKAWGQYLIDHGQPNAIIRMATEFNLGSTFPWGINIYDTTQVANFVAAERTFVTDVRSLPGQNFKIDWNFALDAGNPGQNIVTNAYPGDAYVDYIGIDSYDQVLPYGSAWTNPQDEWSKRYNGTNGAYGLKYYLDFARTHGKKISFPEWGLGWIYGNGPPLEDPYYINQMFALMNDPNNNVAWESFWEDSNGLYTADSSHRSPQSAAAFIADFGGNSTSAPTPVPTATPVPTPTPTPTPVPAVSIPFHMRAGGADYTDSSGTAWKSDSTYTTYGNTDTQGAGKITGTTNPSLYENERWNNPHLGYSIPVANGTYTLKLHFAEISPNVTTAGKRVFSGTAEGKALFSNLDIYSEVGAYKPDDKTYTVTVTGDKLDLSLDATVDGAKLSGLEILPAGTTMPTPTPTVTPPPTTGCTVTGDITCDNHVTSLDLAILLTNWNKQTGATRAQGDLSGDGKVTSLDLAILLSNWGR